MKCLIILTFLFCTVFASSTQDSEQWEQFKTKYGKIYRNAQEENLRYSIFQQKLREIEEHNAKYEAGETSYTKGVNQFSDMTKDEFRATLSHQSRGFSDMNITSIYERPPGLKFPASMDWRWFGAVSEVKNQGSTCGACWTFSVTGTLEGFNYIKNKKMVLFSQQQLLDCVGGQGCQGGNPGLTLRYVYEHGIQTAQSYPYKGEKLTCKYNSSAVALITEGYVMIKQGDEDSLLAVVGSMGPVSVSLDATDLGEYHGGVFHSDTCSKTKVTHAVLAIGYGQDPETGEYYWLIKNSWGKDWGDQGYFKLRRGNNECAIGMQNVFPVL